MRGQVLVRMLQTVTMGSFPEWPAGSVVEVSARLARVMIDAGEAVAVLAADSTVALGVRPMRTR